MQNINESKKQIVKELHKNARKHFIRRHTHMVGINDTFQIDLVEMIPYAKENQNFKYILTIIDIFSKYAWAVPIKSKTATDVTNAINKVLIVGNVPRNIHSDMGKEFYNVQFENLMRHYKINHYSTFTAIKAAIVERFNRTLKSKMWQQMHYNGSYKWISILDNIVDSYNHTKHRTIKLKPSEVDKQNEKILLQTVYMHKKELSLKHKYNVGDSVRISKYKSLFEKGYEPQWTTEIFSIFKIQYTQPITYLLKDYEENKIKGAFYELELQKVKYPDIYLIEKILKRRGGKMYVKWLGFNSTHNSWINNNNLE